MEKHWQIMQVREMEGDPVPDTHGLGQPGPGQVLVRMHAAALNFADLLMAQGRYQETPPLPFIPGLEGAGEILAVGPEVSLTPGTRVAVQAQGTMAEANLFPASRCYPIPEGMTYEEAAGFLVAYGTSHLALTHLARLQAGQTLVVLGAAGGVGLTAVEIGAALGARVIAVARGKDKLQITREVGASDTLDSDDCPDLLAALREMGGVDVVYDPVGGALAEQAFAALRPGGRFLLIGFASGKPPVLPLNHALVKNIAIHGLYWGGYHQLDPDTLNKDIQALFDLYRAGKLHPHAGAVVKLQNLKDGYDLLRNRKATGKVIVSI